MTDPYAFPDLSEASCAEVGTIHFFPHAQKRMTSPDLRAIKELCDSCPVLQACLMYALHVEVEGIWGGTTTVSRKKMRKDLGIESVSLHVQYDLEELFISKNPGAVQQRLRRATRKTERQGS